ncbi:hypothetical protein CKN73_04335 [Carnobacterium divergens]|uniref:biotin transporter BioY n=1 Tax=Carnobacterium divergens TaxID=2748 RepID=UPI001071BFF7|nr:biotin transporter BioY [Carnobacterium divergens]TFJ42781.1 hypothetical protein CKN77_04265 [Carnobacterium divergens]TFJ51321.1 hypothetical protein CKN73_04335 [Carnobacterium divergens]TFJ56318.1 hypothetical protein CKN83_04280 [Carnobacterium divergens]TFJ63855.1 hypothetical protein CKN89_04360 [Carnobacterium divergens]TFJ73013.1 hypothetical protein CKN91_04285 [Carnobacterium divergens]
MKLTTKDRIQIALCTALLSISSLIMIPIGPIPITLQVLFMILIPALLGAKKGMLTIGLYLVLGLIGFPVFAGGMGGLQSLLKPSFGYLIGGFVIAAMIGSVANKNASFKSLVTISVISIPVLYIIGISYAYFLMNIVLETPISLSVLITTSISVFLPLDIIKAIVASFLAVRIRKAVGIKTIVS